MEIQVGERFPFFIAVTQTKQGQMLAQKLPEDQTVVRERDVLFVIPEGVDIEVRV